MSAGMGYGTCVLDIPTYYTQVDWGGAVSSSPDPLPSCFCAAVMMSEGGASLAANATIGMSCHHL
jgi:hypothetical protein